MFKELEAGFYLNLSVFDWVLLATLAIAFITQVIYILTVYVRIPLWKPRPKTETLEGVSIVICAKNEERNLRELIPILMEQNYPTFQVVVVNDNSWDDTQDTLKAFQVSYPNLHCIHLDEDKQQMQGKKFALTLGIKGAKYEQLLLTDADCRPRNKNWIQEMTAGLNHDGTDICLGFSPYKKEKGLLNALIRFDAFQAGINYLGLSICGVPYMGVGRNLAYKKELFFKNSGFRSHMHILSGDDDLFINEVAHKRNTTVALSEDSHTFSFAKTTWRDWWVQKKRHLTTANNYKFFHKVLLMVWPSSFTLLWFTTILWAVMHNQFLIAGGALLLRYLILLVTLHGAMKRLNQRSLFWSSPLLEGLLWILNPLLWASNLLSKPKQWR